VAAPPAVLVIANAARPRPELAELAELVGAERVAELDRLLLRRAMDWAEEVSPGGVRRADDSEALGDAVARAFGETRGQPVLVVWPALPRWRAEHADGVLDDLREGCVASVGPIFDGGLYMLALTRPLPALVALPADTWDSPDAMGLVLGAINEAGVAVGLLRAERGLRRPADVRAALADPLLDAELRALLDG
jgi:glycosyltransferase A (GT-A) superfamily protein (DUF2064 family)